MLVKIGIFNIVFNTLTIIYYFEVDQNLKKLKKNIYVMSNNHNNNALL